jgi:hypothetical protein
MSPRLNKDGEQIIDPDTNEVMVSIDCEATQACGGCPYKTALAKQDGLGKAVYGMFGTDCWYRGKYGNWLLEDAGIGGDDDYSFYGNADDSTYKTARSCIELADLISDFLNDEPDCGQTRKSSRPKRIRASLISTSNASVSTVIVAC